MLRFFQSGLLSALVLALLCGPARADKVIDFDVTIAIEPDSTLRVTEQIVVDHSDPNRHGIFRMIPFRYSRFGQNYRVSLRIADVTDEKGTPQQFSQSTHGRDVVVKIGDPDVIVKGVHRYVLRYTVRRALNFFDGGQPELYWNATGDQWVYPILAARAHVQFPEGVQPDAEQTRSFVGPLGSTEPGSVVAEPGGLLFSADRILQPGEGLTVVVRLPAGSVRPPSRLEQVGWWLRDWWPVAVFPPLALLFFLRHWASHGRDENAGKQATGVEWEPPRDLTPAEVGTLIDEKCDMPDIVATLIDLAARGYVVIEETDAKRFLFLNDADYVFHRTEKPILDEALKPHEMAFLAALFEGPKTQATLSSLRNRFYRHIPEIRRMVYSEVSDGKLFRQNPDGVRSRYMGFGVMLLFAAVFLSVWGAGHGMVAYGLAGVLVAVITILFSRYMPARTANGTRKLVESQGFQRFVTMVEKDRIAQLHRDDPTAFGRLLPFAMVLGVADEWATKYESLLDAPPEWYRGYRRPFTPVYFINDLGHGMGTMNRVMTSAPSSAGSGRSGMSGGGGSGGGFGGGGGGSW